MEKRGRKRQHRGPGRRPRSRSYNPNLWAMIGVAILLLAIAFIIKQFMKDTGIVSAPSLVDEKQTQNVPSAEDQPTQTPPEAKDQKTESPLSTIDLQNGPDNAAQ